MKKLFITIIILSIFIILLMPAINSYSVHIDVNPSIGSTDDFNGIGSVVLGAVQAVGSSISVIVLVIIGIKYMIGSTEERAEYKKSMIPYVIGAVMFFAASNIGMILYNMAMSING